MVGWIGYLDWLSLFLGLATFIAYLDWLSWLVYLDQLLKYLDCSLDWLSGLAMHIWVDKQNFQGTSGLDILSWLSGLGCAEKLPGLAIWIGYLDWLAIWIC